MTLQELHHKLQFLESQRVQLENEILQIKKQIEQLLPFIKEQKIELFKSLFIGRNDVFAKYWVSRDGLKKGYSPATYTFKGNDYIPVSNEIIQLELTSDSEYIFLNQSNMPFYNHDIIGVNFRKILKQRGVKARPLYNLRHTFASQMIS